MKKKMLIWVLLLMLCVVGGAMAEEQWQAGDTGLSMETPDGFTLENMGGGQGFAARMQDEGLGENVVFHVAATPDAKLAGSCLDDLDEAALRELLQLAGGDGNYDCYFDEVSAQNYLLADKETGDISLAVTVHGGYACLFTVRSTQGQLSQAARDGLLDVLAGVRYN